MDAFAVFGLVPSLDLARADLEARYLELSRAAHPDHHRSASAGEQVEVLTRAAAVNDAYRVLRDPWLRAEALLELQAPGTLAQKKTLAPDFLAAALELAEEVATIDRDGEAADALRAHLAELIEDDWRALHQAVARGDWDAAATRLHQARYHRKAQRDLTA